jgi:mannosyltransferase
MTSRSPRPQVSRWIPVLLSVVLALGLLALTLLDYALSGSNLAVVALSLVLLALLSVLLIRIYRGGRRDLRHLPPLPPERISSRAALLILLGLTALAATLRFFHLGQESFSYDEAWTALAASRPIHVVLRRSTALPHLVAHLCLWFGRSEFVLRLGPAFAGVLLIPATYLLGRALYGRVQGLLAAGLLTISVYAIYRSQELRFYAWQMLFSTLTLYFLLRALQHRRWRHWVAFALTTLLNLFSHPFALLVLASEGLYALVVLVPELFLPLRDPSLDRRRRLSAIARRLALPLAGALIALLAFGPGWRYVAALLRSPTWGIDAQPALAGLVGTSWVSSRIATWTYELPGSLLGLQHPALLWAFFVLFFLGVLSHTRLLSSARLSDSLKQRPLLLQGSSLTQRSLLPPVALILLWFLVPPLVLSVVRVRFYYRYLSYFLPLFLLVLAHGLVTLAATIRPHRQQRGVLLAFLAVLVAMPNLLQLPSYYRDTQIRQWREVISFVESHRQPGDLVLITLNYSLWEPSEPFDWYRTVPEDELPWHFFPEGGILEDPSQLDQLPALTQGHPRVWFLFSALDPDGEPAVTAAMQDRFHLVQRQEFLYLNLVLFEAAPSARNP